MDVGSVPERLGLSKERLGRIRTWMQRYIDEAKLPGATTLVARHGEVAFSQTLGYGDLEKKKPLTQDSILRFYSMTKPVTAVAVMMLYEQGIFQLDDPLSAFIPAFRDMKVYQSGPAENPVTKPADKSITIRELMTHTSGLTYGMENEGAVPELYLKWKTEFNPNNGPLEAVVNRLAKIPLEFQPGSRWEYSVSFDVLGRLVEIISGKSLDIFFREHIFEPLGMIDTGFHVPESKLDRFVSLYERTQESDLSLVERGEDSPLVDAVETLSGGGGLVSTLDDYFRFTESRRSL